MDQLELPNVVRPSGLRVTMHTHSYEVTGDGEESWIDEETEEIDAEDVTPDDLDIGDHGSALNATMKALTRHNTYFAEMDRQAPTLLMVREHPSTYWSGVTGEPREREQETSWQITCDDTAWIDTLQATIQHYPTPCTGPMVKG